MSGFGLVFFIGIPFTMISTCIPFIILGIGLDDAFIISGAYNRTSKSKDVSARMKQTIEEVGVSIFTTQLTSIMLFATGTFSSIPAVVWMCQAAIPPIFFDFVFQLTFFVPLIVIDEQRIKAKRRDCLFCTTVKTHAVVDEQERQENKVDIFMRWHSNFLMIPSVKIVVIFLFLLTFGGLAYRTSLWEQRFDFKDFLPKPSYYVDFYDATEKFSTNGIEVYTSIFF